MILKTVTLQEANLLLPIVREHFMRINLLTANVHHLRNLLQESQFKPFIFHPNNIDIKVIKNKRITRKTRSLIKQLKEMEALVEYELLEMMRFGAIIKGIVPPHIDFLSIQNQQIVFLCWHGGESLVEHWHHLDDESAFRHRLTLKDLSCLHLVH